MRFLSIARLPILLTLLLAFIVGCANPRSKTDELEYTLKAYGTAFRWGGVNDAAAFMDPKSLAEKPISDFEAQRYEQMTIVGYRVQSPAIVDENNIATQLVLIELINKHTQSPKTIKDLQRWRYNQETRRWLLTSGLPSLDNVVSGE
jgi:hypothetical protein